MHLYDLLVGLILSLIRSAAQIADRSKAALSSVMLGMIAVLLTVLLALIVSALVMPLFEAEPRGAGGWSLGILICLLMIPFAVALLLAAVTGIVLATFALLGKRGRWNLPLAVLGLLLNLGVLAAVFYLVPP